MTNKKRDIIWNLIGVSINSFNSLFFMIAINHINTKEQAGIFTYAYSLICLFFILATFYNRVYQIGKSDEYKEKDFIYFRLFTSLLTFIIVLLFTLINKYSLYKIAIILFICLFRIIEALSDAVYGIMQKNNQLYLSGISLFIKGLFGIITFIIVDLLTHNIILSLMALIIINIFLFIFFDLLKTKKYISKEWYIQNVKQIFKDSLPIFIYSFLAMYVSNSTKYMLDYFDTAEVQNIYGIIFMPSTMIGLCSSYIVVPFITTLNNLIKEHNIHQFKKCVNKMMISLGCVGILAIICGLTIGIPVLNILYKMDLNAYKMMLVLILIGATFYTLANVYSQILVLLSTNKKQVLIYTIMLFISSIISYFLISKMKLTGAVYAYLIIMFILLIMYLILYFKTVKGEENEISKS